MHVKHNMSMSENIITSLQFLGKRRIFMFEKHIRPGRLTWNIIMEVWKIIFLSKWVICRFHVNLPECTVYPHAHTMFASFPTATTSPRIIAESTKGCSKQRRSTGVGDKCLGVVGSSFVVTYISTLRILTPQNWLF